LIVRVGVHLPQFGLAATPGSVQLAARKAEVLGFHDVWVSDHLIVPANQPRPWPEICDPLVTLSFAAAVTEHIALGTSVLVVPQYPSPLALANSLASLDHLCGGRLMLGVGIGWSRAEFDALGAPFDQRGARLDEILRLWRAAWTEDPCDHEGTFYPSFSDIHLLPKPAHPIPIWMGGLSESAQDRATRLADGYAGVGLTPIEARDLVTRLRARRPDESFTISMRIPIDDRRSAVQTQDLVHEYRLAGIQHLQFAPDRGEPGRDGIRGWLSETERLAEALDLIDGY
jgi:probable F420-dependent oxidoreductase